MQYRPKCSKNDGKNNKLKNILLFPLQDTILPQENPKAAWSLNLSLQAEFLKLNMYSFQKSFYFFEKCILVEICLP